jgi:hypothetical protein
MQAGRLGRALQEFRHALRKNPDSTETLNAIAVAYDLMSRFEMAHHYYDRALALNPSSFQTLNNLGRSYLAKGSVHMASKYLERARSIDPSAPQLQDNLELLAALENPPQSQPVQEADTTGIAIAHAENAWIERTSDVEQTFVTAASPQAVEALATLNVDPRTVSFKADLGNVLSEPIEGNGLLESGSPTPSPEQPARPAASALDSFENIQADERLWRRVVASAETVASDSDASPEPILANAADHDSGVGREQPKGILTAFVVAPHQPTFVRHSPRAIGHQFELSKLALEEKAASAPKPDQTMSLRSESSLASFHGPLNGMMSADAISSQGGGNALVLANFVSREMADERIQSPVLRKSDIPNERPGQGSRRGPIADDAASTRALNACILKKMEADWSSAGATATPAAMALMEVSNGVGRYRMAARMGHYLSTQGFCLSRLSDANVLGQPISRVFYSSGFENQARLIIEALPNNIPMEKDDNLSSNIRLVLGKDLLKFDSLLEKGV